MDSTPPSIRDVTGWTSEQLLEYLKPLFSTFREDQLKKFTDAEIDGELFLREGSRAWFQEICSLKTGPALKLEQELHRIKHGAAPETPNLKRINSNQNPGPTNTTKVKYESPETGERLVELSKKTGANKTAIGRLDSGIVLDNQTRIRRIHQFWEKVNLMSDQPPWPYSIAGLWIVLPFPCEDYNMGLGFATNDRQTTFEYLCRQEFDAILSEIVKMHKKLGHGEYFLCGPQGSGKSHILLALGCLLMRRSKKVLYLPNPTHLARNFVKYVQASLMVTYGTDPFIQSRIQRCNTREEIVQMSRKLSAQMFVIVDQWDAFDNDEGPCFNKLNELSREEKDETMRSIKRLSAGRLLITATSREVVASPVGNTVSINGLSKTEMKAVWNKLNTYLQFGVKEEDKCFIEEQTGRLPALLRPLIHLRTEITSDIYPEDEAYRLYDLLWYSQNLSGSLFEQFHRDIEDFAKWNIQMWKDSYMETQRMLKAWVACLCESPLADSENQFVDWRFFRKQGGIVRATCGMAREILAIVMRPLEQEYLFLGAPWLQKLEHSGSNPLFLDFLVRNMLTASLARKGCGTLDKVYAGERLPCFQFDKQKFDFGGLIKDARKNGKALGLYFPSTFEPHEIDALMVSLEYEPWSGGNTAYLLVIHISLTNRFNEVESTFFRKWGAFQKQLGGFKIIPTFLQVTETSRDGPDVAIIPERGSRKVHGEIHPGNPQYKKIYRSVSEMDGQIGQALILARKKALSADHSQNVAVKMECE
ncbi:hypothetical protein EDC01DRAFT_754786 [Geopyxis carbonaria]|nr:hypothetical protein EDC01DRAFT_754786 [Geopyxis carbonaria]